MTPGVGKSFIDPEMAEQIRARGLPVAAHLSPATQPEDDGRRADLTNWEAAYLETMNKLRACRWSHRVQAEAADRAELEVKRLRTENTLLRAALAEWHRSDRKASAPPRP